MNSEMVQPCPMCGKTNFPDARACVNCGEALPRQRTEFSQQTDQDLLRRFQREVNWLSGLWFLAGMLAAGFGLVAAYQFQFELRSELSDRLFLTYMSLSAAAVFAGIVMMTLGFLAARRNMGSIKVGLVIAYIAIVGNLLWLNGCTIILIAVILLQSHDAISSAKELRQRGIPLDAKL
jgi:membrane-associated HD superfamily phosphohydrolase